MILLLHGLFITSVSCVLSTNLKINFSTSEAKVLGALQIGLLLLLLLLQSAARVAQ